MALSPTMRHALSHMARLESYAAGHGTCPHAQCGGHGSMVSQGTAKALVRRGLAERVQWCRFGADWPELRLTESGRERAEAERWAAHVARVRRLDAHLGSMCGVPEEEA